MRRSRPDYDRERRREIQGLVEKALTQGKELHEVALREDVVPPLEEVAKTMQQRQRRQPT